MKYCAFIFVSLPLPHLACDDEYLYNYRYGIEPPYGYNCDISGLDENGESVSGNIDIEGNSYYMSAE